MAKSEWTRDTKHEKLLPFDASVYKRKDLIVLVNIENDLWHLSISAKDRRPTYEEIKKARYDLLPNSVHMAQIFPPKEEFVNIHENCFHLWQMTPKELPIIMRG